VSSNGALGGGLERCIRFSLAGHSSSGRGFGPAFPARTMAVSFTLPFYGAGEEAQGRKPVDFLGPGRGEGRYRAAVEGGPATLAPKLPQVMIGVEVAPAEPLARG
jgi:hypothetical protein